MGLTLLAAFFAAACNNSGKNTNITDSTSTKDNTNMYDTGAGRSIIDTSHRTDTSLLPNKMPDTSIKK